MKQLILAVGLAFALAPAAYAADTAKEPSPAQKAQQARMKQCNTDATDKKGDERKAFMKTCLSNKPAGPKAAQQEKMKTCNADAKDKKGDEHKAFMKTCLSNKPA